MYANDKQFFSLSFFQTFLKHVLEWLSVGLWWGQNKMQNIINSTCEGSSRQKKVLYAYVLTIISMK